MPSAGHGTQKVFLQVPTAIITIIISIIFLITATIITLIITTTTSGPSSWAVLCFFLIYKGHE